jgi:hypothetical protein
MAAAHPSGPETAPGLKTSPRCPTCGRPNVVTFQAFRAAADSGCPLPPFVCTECCPEPGPDLRAAADVTLMLAVNACLRAERERDEAAEAVRLRNA